MWFDFKELLSQFIPCCQSLSNQWPPLCWRHIFCSTRLAWLNKKKSTLCHLVKALNNWVELSQNQWKSPFSLLAPPWTNMSALTVTPIFVGSLPSTRLKMDLRAFSSLWPLNLFGAKPSRALWKSSKVRTLAVFCLTHSRIEDTTAKHHISRVSLLCWNSSGATEGNQNVFCEISRHDFTLQRLSRLSAKLKTLTLLWRRQCQRRCWWRSCHQWSHSLCRVWPSSFHSAPSQKLWCPRGQQTSEKISGAAPCLKFSPQWGIPETNHGEDRICLSNMWSKTWG